MNWKLPLLVGLTVAAAVSLSLALSTPLPAAPVQKACPPPVVSSGDPTGSPASQGRCLSLVRANQLALSAYTWAVLPHQTYVELCMSFTLLFCSGLAFLLLEGRPVPAMLRRPFTVPFPVRVTAGTSVALGSFVFALAAALDLSNYNPLWVAGMPQPASNLPLYDAASYLARTVGLSSLVTAWTNQWTIGYNGFGSIAGVAMAAGFCGFTGLRMEKGIHAAVKDSVLLYAGPVLLAFESGLWVSNPVIMTWHAAGFASGLQAFGLPLLNNWLVLVTSGLVVCVSVVRLGIRRIYRSPSGSAC